MTRTKSIFGWLSSSVHVVQVLSFLRVLMPYLFWRYSVREALGVSGSPFLYRQCSAAGARLYQGQQQVLSMYARFIKKVFCVSH